MLKTLMRAAKKKVHPAIAKENIPVEGSFQVPFDGWTENKLSLPLIEKLSDNELQELNELLDWKCFVVDSLGRRFGKPAKIHKRPVPQLIPDYRLALLNKRVSLKDFHVLEVGCFEGIHTTGLCSLAKKVTAIDSRINNVVKTIVRTHLFGYKPDVFVFDLEKINAVNSKELECDVIHHIGVLYHLIDPVNQILQFKNYVKHAVFLDTHYATPEMAKSNYKTSDGNFDYYHYKEGGYKDVFSGMGDHAKWLKLEDIEKLLQKAGFNKFELIENRNEKNGPRALIFASKIN